MKNVNVQQAWYKKIISTFTNLTCLQSGGIFFQQNIFTNVSVTLTL